MTISLHLSSGTDRLSEILFRPSAGRGDQQERPFHCEIFDAIGDPIFVQDADTLALIDTNEAGLRLLDTTREAALHPDARRCPLGVSVDGFLHRFSKTRAAEQNVFEFEARLRSGSLSWFEASVRDVIIRGRRCLLSQVRDITGRRHLERQSRYALKMEAIGDLAGGVANDLNSILAAMTLNLGFILSDCSLTPETTEGLRDLEKEAYRAAKVVRQLLYFARRNVLVLEDLELGEFVNAQLPNLRRLAGPEIDLEFQPAACALRVKADKRSLKDALRTLCANARDAITKQGRIIIRLEGVQIEADTAKNHSDVRAGKFACLSVQDTGCGMSKEILERVFEPFFTTKSGGDADGMGLAGVYGTVKQHEGWVQAESLPGKGATFHVYLPQTQPGITQSRG